MNPAPHGYMVPSEHLLPLLGGLLKTSLFTLPLPLIPLLLHFYYLPNGENVIIVLLFNISWAHFHISTYKHTPPFLRPA